MAQVATVTVGPALVLLGSAGAILGSALLASALFVGAPSASAAPARPTPASAALPSAASSSGDTVAWAAQSQTANDEGNMHLVGEAGADLVEEGKMAGTLPGRAKLWFTIGATVSATFTLYPSGGGSVSGHGSGKLRSSGRYASFGGTMAVTSGTGRYRHAHGTGGFYGTILRKSPYPVVVQTRGTLSF
jgi:hypothetical protein